VYIVYQLQHNLQDCSCGSLFQKIHVAMLLQVKFNRSFSTASQLLQGLLSSSRAPIQHSFSSQSLPKLHHNRPPFCPKQPLLRMCLLQVLPAKLLQAICRIRTSCHVINRRRGMAMPSACHMACHMLLSLGFLATILMVPGQISGHFSLSIRGWDCLERSCITRAIVWGRFPMPPRCLLPLLALL